VILDLLSQISDLLALPLTIAREIDGRSQKKTCDTRIPRQAFQYFGAEPRGTECLPQRPVLANSVCAYKKLYRCQVLRIYMVAKSWLKVSPAHSISLVKMHSASDFFVIRSVGHRDSGLGICRLFSREG
jgi:hypothetical protein